MKPNTTGAKKAKKGQYREVGDIAPFSIQLRRLLKRARTQAGMTQAQLAERLLINPRTVQRYEAGESEAAFNRVDQWLRECDVHVTLDTGRLERMLAVEACQVHAAPEGWLYSWQVGTWQKDGCRVRRMIGGGWQWSTPAWAAAGTEEFALLAMEAVEEVVGCSSS